MTEAVVGTLFGLVMGWVIAHSTVATECTRLGAFYVGSSTYKCEVLK
jgi:hypothetical protein